MTVILTATNYDTVLLPYGLPTDMEKEVAEALSSGQEKAIEYARAYRENGASAVDYIYFPNSGRGGVCAGGDTDWTDCSSLDDLADRWINYEEWWSN